MEEVAEILLDQARLQLARQELAIDTLRKEAIAIFSASGIAASLFAPRLSQGARPVAIVAVILFLCGTVAMVAVIVPRVMTFAEKLDGWFPWHDKAIGTDEPGRVAARNIAERLDSIREGNNDQYDRVAGAFVLMCVLFGLQVAAWVVATLIR